jgi:cyclopropane fatty-acyl-phospholipid synthase-like methyltransferase
MTSQPATDVRPPLEARTRLFQMMQAYKTTSLLATGLELGLFDCLAGGRQADADTIATLLDLDPRATRLLLNALAAIDLVHSDGRSYTLAEPVGPLLVRDSPGYIGDMIKVLASPWEWEALRKLPDAVRHGGTVLAEHAETPEYPYWEDFALYASAIAQPTANKVAEALAGWAPGRDPLRVLDLACGHGLYGFTLARHQPQAEIWSLDWPNVLPIARKHAEQMGVGDRMNALVGDMFEIPLGGPYDVTLITNVMHHFSEQRGLELLRRASAATAPGGKVVLVGFTVDDGPPALDPGPHLFSILMLVWTFQGEVHSVSTYERMLATAGFVNPTLHQVPGLPMRIIIADKPEA